MLGVGEKRNLRVRVLEEQILVVLRKRDPREAALMILCCGLEDCAVRLEIPPGSWRRLLDSADERFGGSGAQSPRLLRAGSDGRADFAARARGATLYLLESTE